MRLLLIARIVLDSIVEMEYTASLHHQPDAKAM